MDQEFSQNVFKHVMDTFVLPHVQSLQNQGLLKKPVELNAAQVIFDPEKLIPEVRINSEIKANALAKLKEGFSKNKDDPVYDNEIDGLESIELLEDEGDYGHVTLVRFKDKWIIAFNFVYNKKTAREIIKTSQEFLDAAEFSYQKENWKAFVDNLFNSCELLAKASLLAIPIDKHVTKRKSSHTAIQMGFANLTALIIDTPKNYKTSLDKLSGWRDNGRYAKGELKVDKAAFQQHLETVKDMMKTTRSMVGL